MVLVFKRPICVMVLIKAEWSPKRVAEWASFLSSSMSRFNLARRFWNQVITWKPPEKSLYLCNTNHFYKRMCKLILYYTVSNNNGGKLYVTLSNLYKVTYLSVCEAQSKRDFVPVRGTEVFLVEKSLLQTENLLVGECRSTFSFLFGSEFSVEIRLAAESWKRGCETVSLLKIIHLR